ncbi:unnamed protein product [Schistocephalus solidus]|uniref:Poly [ADP-ribose] polymerase n=1 Tax=Schistocephalus solidus TaxID=70667 RepID=A0A183SXN3_SCHSO|nr:unnamed protein product [Schistocephalus solidus]
MKAGDDTTDILPAAPGPVVKASPKTDGKKADGKVKLLIKGLAPVDVECVEKVDTAHVYSEAGIVYHFMLNQTNLQHNNNKYYMGQLLEDDAAPVYSVWFRWGRVGKTRQHILIPCGSNLQSALAIFTKKFRDKTGNLWAEKKDFIKQPGLYDLIEQDFGVGSLFSFHPLSLQDLTDSVQQEDSKKENVEPLPSKLPPEVMVRITCPNPPSRLSPRFFVFLGVGTMLRHLSLTLIMLICDVKAMERTMREMNYDSRRLPLGKLTPSQINAGYNALNIISLCLDKLEKLRHPPSSDDVPGPKGRPKRVPSCVSESARVRHDLLEACNLFYTRVPHDFGMRIPPLIDTPNAVKLELDLMKSLQDIEVAFNIIHRETRDNSHPADRHYQALKCDINPLSTDDKLLEVCPSVLISFSFSTSILTQIKNCSNQKRFVDGMGSLFNLSQVIKNYVQWTHAPTHSSYDLQVLNVFACNRHGEDKEFRDVGRRYLLWHGSRLTNWMGILGRGLRIAPPEAPCTGYMFGKGIYFADCASKSANYAYASRDRNTGLLALCEVSLGESNELFDADYKADALPAGKQSVMGVGRNTPDPHTWITLPDGVVVPCGRLIEAKLSQPTSLLYNEYVVYRYNQVRLRYLVQLRFNFKY